LLPLFFAVQPTGFATARRLEAFITKKLLLTRWKWKFFSAVPALEKLGASLVDKPPVFDRHRQTTTFSL
jgi:hypothetical protein